MRRYCLKIAAVAVIIISLVSLAACGGSADQGGSASGTAADVSGTAARVGDDVITNDMLDKYAVITTYMYGYDPSSLNDTAKDTVLDYMINSYVIYNYYKGQGLEPLGAEYETNAAQFISLVNEQYPDFIKEYGISGEDLKEFYKSQYLSQTMFTEIESDYSQTDMTENAYNYYTSHLNDYPADDGSGTKSFEDVLQDVYSQLYAQYYEEKLAELKKTINVER